MFCMPYYYPWAGHFTPVDMGLPYQWFEPFVLIILFIFIQDFKFSNFVSMQIKLHGYLCFPHQINHKDVTKFQMVRSYTSS